MSKFNPAKLSVKNIPPATPFEPVEGRRYTLTHSDDTGELFLSIGYLYDKQSINQKLRDEVLAEWAAQNGEFLLIGKVYISNGDYDEKFSRIRYLIFKKELELALTGIIYGDQSLFEYYPWLLDAPIYIRFESIYPEFRETLFCGTPRQYLIASRTKISET